MRKPYIDNLRTFTVYLVVIYHAFYIFNGVGILGGISGAKNIPVLDTVAGVIYPWFMVLLFVVAGMSARSALEKYTAREFIKKRAYKLLLPSTAGLFIVHWITGYLNIKMGGGLEYIHGPMIYPIAAISGTGPLWFVQMLFLFSCLLVLLRRLDKEDSIWKMCGKFNLIAVILLFLPIYGASQILNMPVLTMYRFGIYLTAFLIGYYVFSHEIVLYRIERAQVPICAVAAALGTLYAMGYHDTDYTSPECLQDILTNMYLWAAVMAIISCFREHLDIENPFTYRMARSSYGIYILHYPLMLASGYLLCTYLDLPAILNYLIVLLIGLFLTLPLYRLVRGIPGISQMVLGLKNIW